MFVFTSDSVENLLRDARMPKTQMQRLDRLLLNLYKASDKFGELFFVGEEFRPNSKNSEVIDRITGIGLGNATEAIFWPRNFPISITYARNVAEVKSMLELLVLSGYLNHKDNSSYVITPKGFERAEQILSTNIDSKSVFVAMGYYNDLLEACEKAIKPSCTDCGFNAILISDKPHNNGITDEIITEIKRSKFVVVDFTYNNNGAYFEAGYAQGLGLPLIRCCKKEWFDGTDEEGNQNRLHFDVQHYSTILWKDHEDFKKQLKANIRANIKDAFLFDEDKEG